MSSAVKIVISMPSEEVEDIFQDSREFLFRDNGNIEAIKRIEAVRLRMETARLAIHFSKVQEAQFASIDEAAEYCLRVRYWIPGKKSRVVNYLENSIVPCTVGRILEIADYLNEETLSSKCWMYILEHSEQVLRSTSFRDLRVETASAIVRQDVMTPQLDEEKHSVEPGSETIESIRELTVYKAVVDWGRNEYKRRQSTCGIERIREILEPLLCHIRFLLMEYSEIADDVCSDEILTHKEQLEIFKTWGRKKLIGYSGYLNLCTERRKCFSSKMMSLSCCPHLIPNASQPKITERFRLKSHNLYILGILKHRSFENITDFTFRVCNITRDKDVMLRKLQNNRNGDDIILFDSAILVREDDIFEITIESNSEVMIPCCTDHCDTSPLLERISENQTPCEPTGHLSGIYALPIIP